jgi:DNA-binding beta-propeller fold protein YncE
MRALKSAILIALVLNCLAGISSAQDKVLRLAGTIALPGIKGRIDHLAATADGRSVFVAALSSNRVLRIDTESARVSGVIAGIKAPQGIAYLSKSNQIAVASGGDGEVRFYSADTLRLLGAVRGLADADNVRYDADANLVYAGYGDGALVVIDPEMMAPTARIPLDGHPESFQLEKRGTRIFINVPAAGEVEVFDRATRRLLNEWKLKPLAANFPMALDEAGQRLYIGTRKPPGIAVMETEAGKVIGIMSACGDADDLFHEPREKLVFLSGGQGCVNVFRQAEANDYQRVETVNTFPGARTSLLVAPAQRLYVAVPRQRGQVAEIMVFAVGETRKEK